MAKFGSFIPKALEVDDKGAKFWFRVNFVGFTFCLFWGGLGWMSKLGLVSFWWVFGDWMMYQGCGSSNWN